MTYSRQTWNNNDPGTPLNATRLQHMEDGIAAASTSGGAITTVAGRTGDIVLTKVDVSLANVDNTADASKPVSGPQATANTAILSAAASDSTSKVATETTRAMTAEGINAAAIATNASAVSTETTNRVTAVASAITTAQARSGHTGTQSADTLTDGTTNKAFLATERTKLTGIATSATANSTDATLLSRVNHTGTQLAATISDLATGVPVQSVAGRTGVITLTKTDVGLSNLDNTSDVNKPVSTAQGNSIATKTTVFTPTAVKTAAYTASPFDFVPVDTTSTNVTISLPSAPADGSRVAIKFVIQGGTNVVAYTCTGSDVINKTGGVTSSTLTLLGQTVTLQYKASGAIWYIQNVDLPLSLLDVRYSPASPVTTKGDLVATNASGVSVRHAAGADGTVLAYDSSQVDGLTSVVPAAASNSTPIIDGTATAGTAATFSRSDHVHPSPLISALWGDGSDGSYTLDGTQAAVANLFTKSGNTYTLTNTLYLTNLTIAAGVTLFTNNYIVFCSGTLTVASTGIINNNGVANTTTGNAAQGAITATLVYQQTSGTGVTAINGTAGALGPGAPGYSGSGGGGGAGSGGTVGTTASSAASLRTMKRFPSCFSGVGGLVVSASNGFAPGGPGGGGGGDLTNKGGGGGQGAGVIVINTRFFVHSGSITAIGGAGFTPTVGIAGGGGGGGGGGIIVNCQTYTLSSGTYSCAGGAGGSGVGGGGTGTSGNAGLSQVNVWA